MLTSRTWCDTGGSVCRYFAAYGTGRCALCSPAKLNYQFHPPIIDYNSLSLLWTASWLVTRGPAATVDISLDSSWELRLWKLPGKWSILAERRWHTSGIDENGGRERFLWRSWDNLGKFHIPTNLPIMPHNKHIYIGAPKPSISQHFIPSCPINKHIYKSSEGIYIIPANLPIMPHQQAYY